jgi:endonuclease/exonuclease/phosphatase family metal-dependent hydrolase
MFRATNLFIVIIAFCCFNLCSEAADAVKASLNVMTFNVRYNTAADSLNAWPNRKAMVASVIGFHQTDIVGVQEALAGQVRDLNSLLKGYEWFGVGRDDGKEAGEFSAVFYKTDRFQKLDGGNFWLSETPDKPGSMGWDAAYTRICTWLKLQDRVSGKTFCLFNTHFDHVGEIARQNSARLLREKIASLAGVSPVILCGDFNCASEDAPYRILTGSAADGLIIKDAQKLSQAAPYGSDYSFNGFEDRVGEGIIDFIFVPANVKVIRHGVISERWNGRYPSDHFPVMAEILLQ